jgi:hypothetical protein
MRRQVSEGRFGLVFGSGLSKRIGIPTWKHLVRSLARDPRIQGEDVLEIAAPRAGLPYLTEVLFEHYKRKRYEAAVKTAHHTRQLDFQISAEWRELIRERLYADVKGDLGEAIAGHPYLAQYIPLIQHSRMTVTYNFDDLIEQALLHARGEEDKDSRGFESVTNPWAQFRRSKGVIYHPNGVIPQNFFETPSDRFVFSEASYAEQLVGIFSGDHAGLLNHLSKHTCLLIGLSLEDDTLRNVLMQGARSCPGNYHYYVHFLNDGELLGEEHRLAIALANFKVYNLVTLFLYEEGIRALGELIDVGACSRGVFRNFAAEHGIRIKFSYYFTGSLGVGKSTAINNFRNLVAMDEWLDPRPRILAKAWSELSMDERRAADEWIVGQFRRKNDILKDETEGIFVLDRGPADPMAFTPDDDWTAKADVLLSTLCPGHADWRIEGGKVILLRGDANELSLRMVMAHRLDYTTERLRDMEVRLAKAYGTRGVTDVDTSGMTPVDVARRIAEIIHLEPYEPICDLHKRLHSIQEEGYNAP